MSDRFRQCAAALVLVLLGCNRSPAPQAADAPAQAPLAGARAGTDAQSSAPSPPRPLEAPDGATPASAEPAGPITGEWTAATVEVRRDGRQVVLRQVRAARNAGFDRLVFEFDGETLPGYRIGYVDRPARHCGSGEPLVLPGDGLLEVRLSPAVAHDEAGQLTVNALEAKPNLPVLLALEQSCDFEGVVSWVAGMKAPNRYFVLELKDPARLVIDVRH
ncbi:MAG: hypothetical protein ACK4N5_20300, partial [Myxococcales bacterium]